jgi:NADH-quinone oxidoreductase subunit M
MVLALIGIIYGALVSLVQPNMKKLIAYSSISHLDSSSSEFSASPRLA